MERFFPLPRKDIHSIYRIYPPTETECPTMRIIMNTVRENRYFRVLYAGPHLGKLHPVNEKRIRERFDELSHKGYEEVMKEYREIKKRGNFVSQSIQEKKEEYNLWQDRLWDYI